MCNDFGDIFLHCKQQQILAEFCVFNYTMFQGMLYLYYCDICPHQQHHTIYFTNKKRTGLYFKLKFLLRKQKKCHSMPSDCTLKDMLISVVLCQYI